MSPPSLGQRTPVRLLLDVAAFGIVRASRELAEAALLDHEVRLALRALLVEDLVRLRGGEPCFVAMIFRVVLHSGIAGAGEELAEPAALDDHRLAAVFARLLDLPFGAGLGRFELAGVLALGIAAAGEEQAELARLDDHRLAALVAGDRRVGLVPFLEIRHLLFGALQVLLELLVEVATAWTRSSPCLPRSCRGPPRARACS